MSQQIIPMGGWNADVGFAELVLPVLSQANTAGSWSFSATFAGNCARIPCAAPGLFRNLNLLAYGTHPNVTTYVRKNTVRSALLVALTGAQYVGSDLTDTVTVAQGDDIDYDAVNASTGTGYNLSASIEFDPTTPNTSIYGIAGVGGGVVIGQAFYGGAFGNGIFQAYAGYGSSSGGSNDYTSSSDSNTYSICSLTGTVTTLVLKEYAGPLGSSVWTGYVRKNGVVQDGTGGTVNTACVLSGSMGFAVSTFSLPCVPTDHFDVVVVLSGANLAFALVHVAAGIGVVSPSGQFMLCGGSNNAIDTGNPNWMWNGTQQLVTPEAAQQVPVGVGFYVGGLYEEFSADPAGTAFWTTTFRQNAANTPIVVVVSGLATKGSILAGVTLAGTDLVTLQAVPTNTPQATQIHWGLAIGCLPSVITGIQ